MAKTKTNETPLKILLPFRTLGFVFGAIALLTFLSALLFAFNKRPSSALLYASYGFVDAILAFGLWKMRKWVVTIFGSATVLVVVLNALNLSRGAQKMSQAITGVAILGVVFLFTFFSRNFLNDEYKNTKAILGFLSFLILSQIILIFLR
ncbi:MAG: hypothetical protein PHW24_03110 [Candidatus Moranbacteria bacterium]|nr:hypothetical protein [Candidatus Moranbacteria bacterium]